MQSHSAEVDAASREVLAFKIGFFVTFTAAFGIVLWLLFVYMLPSQGWLDTVMAALQLLFITAGAGCWSGWALSRVVQRWHYSRGVYRCVRCNRALIDASGLCVCWPREERLQHVRHRTRQRRKRRDPLRHYRRRVIPVLVTYAAVLVVILLCLPFTSRTRTNAADVAFAHAVLCVGIKVGIDILDGVLSLLGRGRRFRLRAAVFQGTLVAWPIVMLLAGLFIYLLGYDVLN